MQPFVNRSYHLKEHVDEKINTAAPQFEAYTDEAIWQLFKEENESSFIFIYREYANLLFNYGCKFSSNRELVEDCLQDFFLYLRRSRRNLGNTTSIKMYLLKSFRRRVIEYLNKSSNEKKKNFDYFGFELDIEDSAEVKYINKHAQERQLNQLRSAMENLDSKEREAVYQFYYGGLSYKEIAELLEFTHVSSARRLIYRALRHLKELI